MQLDDITLTADDHGQGRRGAAAATGGPGPGPSARHWPRSAVTPSVWPPVLWPLLIGAKRKEQP